MTKKLTAKKLTATGIEKLKAGETRREIRDAASGLSLQITPTGHKSFVMRFRRPDGRPAKLTLGSFDPEAPELEGHPKIGMPLSLASARWLAAEISRQRKMPGKDVIADLAATKQRRRIDADARAYTFPAAAKQFIAEHARENNRTWREVARLFGLDYPKDGGEPKEIEGSLAMRWQDRSVTEITDHDIFAAIDEARRRGIPGLEARNPGISDARGRHLGRALGRLFKWLLQHRKIAADPCLGMFVPPPSKKRARVLTDAEMAALWRAAGKIGYPFGGVLRLLMLTGSRRDEVAGLRMEELSEGEDGTRWAIPAARVKNKLDFRVPISPAARDVIDDAVKFAGDSGFLFTTTGDTAVSGFSKIKPRVDALMMAELGDAFQPWRIHDIRRTVVTGMASIKIAPHVVEACVNHVSGFRAGVAGTYNKFQYEDEKREALTAWARHLDQIVSGGGSANVVPIRGKR